MVATLSQISPSVVLTHPGGSPVGSALGVAFAGLGFLGIREPRAAARGALPWAGVLRPVGAGEMAGGLLALRFGRGSGMFRGSV